MPGGLNEVTQVVGADASKYIAEYRAALAVTKELSAATKELAAAQSAMQGGGSGGGAAAADIARTNAAIREGLAALREHQSAVATASAATGNYATVVKYLGTTHVDATTAIRGTTTALGEQARASSDSAAGLLPVAASLGAVRDTATATTRSVKQTTEALNEQTAALQARASAATSTVQVETRSVYGREAYYPANDVAKLFMEIAGRKEQVPGWVLQLASQLGYAVQGAAGFTGGGSGVRSSDVVQVQTKTVYDKPLAYPANEAAQVFATLASTKTLTENTRKLIGDLGYTIEDLGKAASSAAPGVASIAAAGLGQDAVAAVQKAKADVSSAVGDAAVAGIAAASGAGGGGSFPVQALMDYARARAAETAAGAGGPSGLSPSIAAAVASAIAAGGGAAGGPPGGGGGGLAAAAGAAAGSGPGGGGGGGNFVGSLFGNLAGGAGGFLGGALANINTGGVTSASAWKNTASAIATWYPRIHWAMMLTNEVLATAGPAAIAALSAGAVGLEGGQTAYSRMVGVNAVGQSIGPSLGATPGQYLGIGDSLQKAQTQADPQVWELMGAGLNAVKAGTDSASGGLQNFWQMGTNTIDMMDRFGAQVDLDFKNGMGKELVGAVAGGTQDLQQFGDVLGNVGDTVMHVIPSLPGVGSDLLTTLQGATKLLSVGTGIASSTGLLGPVLALEAGSRYGPALVGGVGSLVGRVGQGLTTAGASISNQGVSNALASAGGFLGAAPRTALASDVGNTYNPATGGLVAAEGEDIAGTGLAGALGGLTPLAVGGIAAATYLTAKGIGWQTPEQQTVAGMLGQTGTDSFTGAYSGILGDVNQLATTASQPQGGGFQQATSSFTEFGNAVKNLDIPEGVNSLFHILTDTKPPSTQSTAMQGIQQLTQQYQELSSAGAQIAKVMGVSIPEAYTMADQAGLQLSSAIGANGQLNPIALQQIVNAQTGLSVMTGKQGSPVYTAGVNAIAGASGISGSQVGTLNSSYDTLLGYAAGGTSAAVGFSGGLDALSDLALPAAQKDASSKTVKAIETALGISSSAAQALAASGGSVKSVQSIAQALTGFTSQGSQAAWSAYSNTSSTSPGVLQQVESMMDQLRVAQTAGVLSQGQVAGAGMYEAQQLLPFAKQSPAALAQLGFLGQEAGLNTTYNPAESQAENYKHISQAISGAATSAKGYTATQNQMAIGMSNVSQVAQSFGNTMATDVQNTMAGAAASMPKATAAMTDFAGSIGSSKLDTSALKTVASTLKGAGENVQSAQLMLQDVGTLHGASPSQLAQIKQQVDLTYSTPKPPDLPDLPDVKWNSVIGTPKVPPVPPIPPVLINSKVNVPALPPVPHPGTVNFPSAVTKPIPPPPPPGGTVKYTSSVVPPVAPPAPRGGVIVYTTTVVGPGPMTAPNSGAGGTATVIGGVGNVRLRSQTGGLVPGAGSGDIVPAMLEPGEAIIPKYLVPLLAPILAAHRVPGFGAPASGASHFAAGGLVDAGLSASQIQAQINAAYNTLDTMTQGSTASNAFWKSTLDPLYAALDALKGKATSTATAVKAATSTGTGTGGGPALGWTLTGQQGQAPLPAAVQGVIDNLLQEVAKSNIGKQFAVTLAGQFNSSIKNLPTETKSIASSLVSQIGTEVGYAKNVASAAQLGQGYGTQGLISGMDVDPATGNGSVFSQMQSYLGSEQGFTSDLKTLTKDGLSKGIASQLIAAGPVQGDALAQSILGDYGGVQGVNKLWAQIGTASKALGAQSAMSQYGGKLSPDLTSGTFVSNNVSISVSAENNGTLNLTAAQITSLTEQIQAKLLQQAKRNPKTGLKLTGKGS